MEGSTSGLVGGHAGRGHDAGAVASPVRLLDLDDDSLRLIAARCWEGGSAAGLIGACRRTRRAGLAALTRLRLTWCAACEPRRQSDETCEAVATAAGPHPPSLATRLPSLLSFLSRASGIRQVRLHDGRPRWMRRLPCHAPCATRERVWREVGEALRGIPLAFLSVRGEAAAALIGLGSPGCAAVRSLQLERLADLDADHRLLGTLLRAMAPSLECLVTCVVGWPFERFVRGMADAQQLPALQKMSLGTKFGTWRWPPLGHAEAATFAAVCPNLRTLQVSLSFGCGFGRAWAATRGYLTHLRVLHLYAGNERTADMGVELAHVLAGRRLDELTLCAPFDSSGGVLDAILGCERLPAALGFPRLCMTPSQCLRLCRDNRAAEDLVSLSLPAMDRPETFLPGLGSLPWMLSLQLTFFVSDVDVGLLRPGTWVVPPRLRHLSVDLGHVTIGGSTPPSVLPLVAWLARCIAEAPCVATLHELTLHAPAPPEQPLYDALSLLAGASSLRVLDLSVQEVSNDEVGKQARLQGRLATLFPLAKVRVRARR